jgi:hypothetical protein
VGETGYTIIRNPKPRFGTGSYGAEGFWRLTDTHVNPDEWRIVATPRHIISQNLFQYEINFVDFILHLLRGKLDIPYMHMADYRIYPPTYYTSH